MKTNKVTQRYTRVKNSNHTVMLSTSSAHRGKIRSEVGEAIFHQIHGEPHEVLIFNGCQNGYVQTEMKETRQQGVVLRIKTRLILTTPMAETGAQGVDHDDREPHLQLLAVNDMILAYLCQSKRTHSDT